jgi:hypothetical protein
LVKNQKMKFGKNATFNDTFLFDDDRQDSLVLKIPSYRATEIECRKIIEILKGGEKIQEMEQMLRNAQEAGKSKPGLMALETMQGLQDRSQVKAKVAQDIMKEFADAPPREKAIKDKLLDPFPVIYFSLEKIR